MAPRPAKRPTEEIGGLNGGSIEIVRPPAKKMKANDKDQSTVVELDGASSLASEDRKRFDIAFMAWWSLTTVVWRLELDGPRADIGK